MSRLTRLSCTDQSRSLALPLVFHVFNGTRMLLFDATLGLKNQVQVKRSGWAVVRRTTIVSLALVTKL